MLLEIYAQSVDATAVYSVYITLLLSISMSALWMISNPSFIDSYILKVKLKPTDYESAFKNIADLGTRIQLLILKRIRIKIDPGDEDSIFLHFKN